MENGMIYAICFLLGAVSLWVAIGIIISKKGG